MTEKELEGASKDLREGRKKALALILEPHLKEIWEEGEEAARGQEESLDDEDDYNTGDEGNDEPKDGEADDEASPPPPKMEDEEVDE